MLLILHITDYVIILQNAMQSLEGMHNIYTEIHKSLK